MFESFLAVLSVLWSLKRHLKTKKTFPWYALRLFLSRRTRLVLDGTKDGDRRFVIYRADNDVVQPRPRALAAGWKIMVTHFLPLRIQHHVCRRREQRTHIVYCMIVDGGLMRYYLAQCLNPKNRRFWKQRTDIDLINKTMTRVQKRLIMTVGW
jgi:hypothetical protein